MLSYREELLLECIKQLQEDAEVVSEYRQIHRKWYEMQGREPGGSSVIWYLLAKLKQLYLIEEFRITNNVEFKLTPAGVKYLDKVK